MSCNIFNCCVRCCIENDPVRVAPAPGTAAAAPAQQPGVALPVAQAIIAQGAAPTPPVAQPYEQTPIMTLHGSLPSPDYRAAMGLFSRNTSPELRVHNPTRPGTLRHQEGPDENSEAITNELNEPFRAFPTGHLRVPTPLQLPPLRTRTPSSRTSRSHDHHRSALYTPSYRAKSPQDGLLTRNNSPSAHVLQSEVLPSPAHSKSKSPNAPISTLEYLAVFRRSSVAIVRPGAGAEDAEEFSRRSSVEGESQDKPSADVMFHAPGSPRELTIGVPYSVTSLKTSPLNRTTLVSTIGMGAGRTFAPPRVDEEATKERNVVLRLADSTPTSISPAVSTLRSAPSSIGAGIGSGDIFIPSDSGDDLNIRELITDTPTELTIGAPSAPTAFTGAPARSRSSGRNGRPILAPLAQRGNLPPTFQTFGAAPIIPALPLPAEPT